LHRYLIPLALLCLAITPALAQDASAGQTVFNRCKACHDIGANATSRMGPVLTGVVGRVAGTYPGYNYSNAMGEAGSKGLVWTPDALDPFLTSPRRSFQELR